MLKIFNNSKKWRNLILMIYLRKGLLFASAAAAQIGLRRGGDWIDIIPYRTAARLILALPMNSSCAPRSSTEPQNMTRAFNCKLLLAPRAQLRRVLCILREQRRRRTHLSVTEAPNLLQIDRKSICQTAAYFNISHANAAAWAAAGTLWCECAREMCELNDFRERHTHVLLRFEEESLRAGNSAQSWGSESEITFHFSWIWIYISWKWVSRVWITRHWRELGFA